MQEAFVNICDIPTHIMTWGKWIEESFSDEKEVVICITGNPGLPGFYSQFMSTIHNNIDPKIPVWVIGHLGHDDPPLTSIRKVPALEGNEHKFDLDAQIKHKIEFIETYVPQQVKIHLIGHSIGAYMSLKLLKNESIKKRIKKCYLLFPTIERMRDSPNGKVFTYSVSSIYVVLKLLIRLLYMLPNVVRIFILFIYFWFSSIPRHFLGTGLKYSKPTVMDCVVFLAKDEMAKVGKLDSQIIQENKELLKLYYGTTDGWVPVQYYKEFKEKFPDIDATLDKRNIYHSFVLRSSVEMGEIVADWIKQYKIRD